MAHCISDETASRRKMLPANRLLLVGAACAGLLGAGVGIWARPAMNERRMAVLAAQSQPAAPPAQRQIQIVVDDAPAPIGEPIAVLPAHDWAARPMVGAAAPPLEPTAPVRNPQALVRIHASVLTPPAPAASRATTTKARRLTKGKTDAAASRFAKVKAREARETRIPRKPAGVIHVRVRLVSRPAKAEPKPVLQKTSDRHGHGRKGPPAILQTDRAHPARARHVETAHSAKTHAFVQPPRPVGLMRVSTPPHCTSADPGAALVCADPVLGAADRQLARAYRQAQAAGVSDERLQRQQQRWLVARSAAAREAPWAVRDVYVARIAELNGMAHEARGPSN